MTLWYVLTFLSDNQILQGRGFSMSLKENPWFHVIKAQLFDLFEVMIEHGAKPNSRISRHTVNIGGKFASWHSLFDFMTAFDALDAVFADTDQQRVGKIRDRMTLQLKALNLKRALSAERIPQQILRNTSIGR